MVLLASVLALAACSRILQAAAPAEQVGAAPKLGLPLFRPLPAAPFTLAARPAGHTKRTGRAAQPLLQFSEDGDDEEYERAVAEHAGEVVSPFADAAAGSGSAGDGPLPLTLENVDLVLEDMRPYLLADGGNVAVRDIEGGVVYLELQGACGSCPSSAMTLQMGLERGLREKIPEIIRVEEVSPEGPVLDENGVEGCLDEIRPFLKMAGGSVEMVDLNVDSVQPTVTLLITGNGSTINSVRAEIAARLKRNFPRLANVKWDTE